MKPTDKLTKFYQSYQKENETLFKEDIFAQKIYEALLSGDKEVYQKNVSETKIFDEKWIETLESYLPSINKIMRNPKSDLKYEDDIVLIEKARKTSARSIKHLAANTHLIKEIKDEQIRPKKILVTHPEIEYATYENRMVSSLVERLFYFVRARAEIIRDYGESFLNKTLMFKSEFPFNETTLTFDLKLNIKEPPENEEINKYNQQLLERVETLEKLVTGFMNDNFMKELKGLPKVRTPIMKTSVILKNPDYHNCYLLWLFLDRYNTLAFETEIKEKTMELDEAYLESIYRDIIVNLSTVIYHQERRRILYNSFDKVKRKKSLKVIKDLEVKAFLEEDIEVEDENINQYYLEQNMKLFSQSLEYHKETSSTYEVALKRALRETIEFSNALYRGFFEIPEEEDIFRRLVTQLNPQEEIEKIREMTEIAKAVREVKAVDFRKEIRRETNFLTKLLSLNKELTNNQEKYLAGVIAAEKAARKLLLEEEEALLRQEHLKEEYRFSQEEEERLNKLRLESEAMFKKLEKAYNDNLRKALADLNKEYQEKTTETLSGLTNRHQAKLRLIEREGMLAEKMLANQHQELKARLEEERRVALETEETLLKGELASKEAAYKEELEKEMMSLKARLESELLSKKTALETEKAGLKVAHKEKLKPQEANLKTLLEAKILEVRKDLLKAKIELAQVPRKPQVEKKSSSTEQTIMGVFK